VAVPQALAKDSLRQQRGSHARSIERRRRIRNDEKKVLTNGNISP
jgi:hypothetical protein